MLVPSVAFARDVARFDDVAERLAERCWPGALTLVLPRAADSRGWDLGGDGATIGVRVPAHPLARAVLAGRAARGDEREPVGRAYAFDVRRAAPGLRRHGRGLPLRGSAARRAILDGARPGARRTAILRRGGGGGVGDRASAPRREGTARLAPHVMTSILVVCTGNICRSPIAEGMLREAMAARFGASAPTVSSAGTIGVEGSPATEESVTAAASEASTSVATARADSPSTWHAMPISCSAWRASTGGLARGRPGGRGARVHAEGARQAAGGAAATAAGRRARVAAARVAAAAGRGRPASRATRTTRTSPTRSGCRCRPIGRSRGSSTSGSTPRRRPLRPWPWLRPRRPEHADRDG